MTPACCTTPNIDPSQVSAAHLHNIIARLPGTDSTGTVMLYGHYGSVPTSPNAADGAAGVAAVLETVRALRAGPPLRNDVLVVLADGDETPALGPHLFRGHPAAKDVTVGIALEGLSNRGVVALAYAGQGTPNVQGSYTSAANGSWLRQALSVMPHRFTTLALNDMQIASPELSIATKDAAAGGIGSLILGGGEAYHTVRDSPANLDVANLQAHGDNTLALARHFGDAALDRQPSERELVAFTVLPNTVLGYPSTWAVGLLVLIVVMFLALLIIGFLRGVLTGWGVAVGLGITVLSLPIAIAVDVAAWLAVVAINPAYRAPMGRGYYGATWNLAFLTCLTLATVFALHVLARRFLRPARDDLSVAAGALLVPLVLAALTSFTFPAFSYVFAWPTLAAALLVGWRVLQPSITGRPWTYLAGLVMVMVITTVHGPGTGLFDLLGLRRTRKRPGVADLPGDRTGHRRRGRPGATATPAFPRRPPPLDGTCCVDRAGRGVPGDRADHHPFRRRCAPAELRAIHPQRRHQPGFLAQPG